MSILHLPLKRLYFDQIKARTKPEEYRLMNEFWDKRLYVPGYNEFKDFYAVRFTMGYPKSSDQSRIITREFKGIKAILGFTHEFFGEQPVNVFAIDATGKDLS